jgi:hypothetical protein
VWTFWAHIWLTWISSLKPGVTQHFFSTNLSRPQNKQTRNPFILLGPALLFLVEDMFGLGLRALLLNPSSSSWACFFSKFLWVALYPTDPNKSLSCSAIQILCLVSQEKNPDSLILSGCIFWLWLEKRTDDLVLLEPFFNNLAIHITATEYLLTIC